MGGGEEKDEYRTGSREQGTGNVPSSRFPVPGSVFVLFLSFAGCSSSESTTPQQPQPIVDAGIDVGDDAFVDIGDASDTYPAYMPSVPQVVNLGGPTMAAPRVVPAFFPGHPFEHELTDFLPKFVSSPAWSAITSEYGVGAATIASAVDVTTTPAATMTDAEVASWLASQLDGTHPEWGATDDATIAQSLYVLFFPASTTITFGPGGFASCTTFAGYHEDARLADGRRFAYAIMPLCPARLPSAFDSLTAVTSHELVEAATDPYPNTSSAFGDVDEADVAWSICGFGGEIGDLCEARQDNFFYPSDIGYRIQRSWSDKAAKAFHDPCVPYPAADTPYFNAAPVADEPVDVLFQGRHYMARGVNVAMNQTRTIEIDLFSDKPTSGPWSVGAYNVFVASDGTILPIALELSMDAYQGQNGNKLHLTITRNAPSPVGASFVRIDSRLGMLTQSWFLAVGS
jgi:hypothetical protein